MRFIDVMIWLVFLVLPAQEITDWFVFVGAIGAAVFSWGLANYQKYRATVRKEDEEDRKSMRASVIENARVLAEMEVAQKALQEELDNLNLKSKQSKESDS